MPGREFQHPPTLQSLLEFARALCDEINNPLLAAAGHLQLLELALTQGQEPAEAHTKAASRELQRVRDRVAKVAALARAGSGDRRQESVPVVELVRDLDLSETGGLTLDKTAEAATLHGDPELLRQCLQRTVSVAAELMEHPPELRLRVNGNRLQGTVRLPSAQFGGWERADDPLPLSHIRGFPHLALDLFLVQAVAEAHSGSALLQRRHDEAAPRIRLDLGPVS